MKRICFNIFYLSGENPVSQQGDCLTVVKVPSFSIFLKENSPKICFVNLLANFFFGSEMNLIHIYIFSLPLLNSSVLISQKKISRLILSIFDCKPCLARSYDEFYVRSCGFLVFISSRSCTKYFLVRQTFFNNGTSINDVGY